MECDNEKQIDVNVLFPRPENKLLYDCFAEKLE